MQHENKTSAPVTVIIDKPWPHIVNVANQYDELRVMYLSPAVDLIKSKDIVLLSNQRYATDNGRYIVTKADANSNKTYLTTMPVVRFYDHFYSMKTMRTDMLVGRQRDAGGNKIDQVEGMVWFSDLGVPGTVSNGMATVYARPDPTLVNECIGDPDSKTRETCTSEYDGLGLPKTPGVWDRRCKGNSECPFFDMKTRRGGCGDNGFCELPLGVDRIGYRIYRGDALRHGDDDGSVAFAFDSLQRRFDHEPFVPDDSTYDEVGKRAPAFELNDADFYKLLFADMSDQFSWPALDRLIVWPMPTPHLFLNDACTALLLIAGPDAVSYSYVFGRADLIWLDQTDGALYFTETAAIKAPSKAKAKVVRFDCKMNTDGSFLFRDVTVLGSIVDGDLAF